MTVRNSKWLVALLVVTLMVSLLSFSAFADTTAVAEGSGEVTGEVSGEVSGEVTGEGTDGEGTDTEAAGETTKAPTADTTTASGSTSTEKETPWDLYISGGIILVAIIVLTVLFFASKKFNEKVKTLIREYAAELKKVSWSSKKDVINNTIVVLVFVLGLAIIIGLLDLLFGSLIALL